MKTTRVDMISHVDCKDTLRSELLPRYRRVPKVGKIVPQFVLVSHFEDEAGWRGRYLCEGCDAEIVVNLPPESKRRK